MSGRPVVIYLNLRRTALEHGAALEAAHQQGFDVALIADTVPPRLPTAIVAAVHRVNTYDPTDVDAAVDAIVAAHPVAGVVTWSDRDVATVSRIAGRLGLPAPAPAAAAVARNKYLMREALGAHREMIPAYARITSEEDLAKAEVEIGYPAVLKPTSASGSKGIFLLHRPEQLAPAYQALMHYTRPEVDKVFTGNPNELIYEELLVGTEHSVEGFVYRGEILIAGVTDKETSEPYRLEVGHIHPSSLPADALREIDRLVHTVIRAMNLDNCTFHLECMVTPDGSAKLVEIAARVGGDFITSHLVGFATGVPFYENVIRVATGARPILGGALLGYAGVRKIMAERAGEFQGLAGLAEIEEAAGVRHVVVERAPGAMVRLPPADFMSSTLGAVIAVGESPTEVQRRLRSAVEAVDIRFARDSPS